jgi:hypothetical protein
MKLARWALLVLCSLPAFSQIQLTPHGVFSAGGSAAAEIPAYDAATKRVFSVNGAANRVDIIDIHDIDAPASLGSVLVGGAPTSVAVKDGIVAVAVEGSPKTSPGKVVFLTTGGSILSEVTVGSLPDMVTFTQNGRKVLTANEGEPNSYNQPDSVDPEGTVSIIDLSVGVENLTDANVTTVHFDPAGVETPRVNPESIRHFGPNATFAQDMEPEYLATSIDPRYAWVTLQENNAIAELDLVRGVFTKVTGLGFKDMNSAGNAFDASDRDNGSGGPAIHIAGWPVYGMYMPDGIASYRAGGKTYLVMANEGDARDYTGYAEEIRVGSSSYPLNATVFPNAADLKLTNNLGRLTVTLATGDDNPGEAGYERIMAFGGRSFTIRNTDGSLVYDSGGAFEQITSVQEPTLFNGESGGGFDTRSDNKGPEPEGIALGRAYGRDYAFIGLERIGGVMVYDITNPDAPNFVQWATSTGDFAPEGLVFVSALESPTNKPLVIVSSEVSGTVRIFEVSRVSPQ